MKKIWIILALIILSLAFKAEAQIKERGILPQLDYPAVRGLDLDQLMREGQITLDTIARYVYYFFITIGGIVALTGLVLAGIKWLLYSGSPSGISEAKQSFLAVFLGMIILFGSWVILNTLDPHLKNLPLLGTKAKVPTPPERGPLPGESHIRIYVEPSANTRLPRSLIEDGIALTEESFPILNLKKLKIGNKVYDLSGGNNSDGKIVGVRFFLKSKGSGIDWVAPKGPTIGGGVALLPQIPEFHYGVVCFEEPQNRGRFTLVFSMESLEYNPQTGFLESPSTPIPLVIYNNRISDNPESPCQSLGLIKVPTGGEVVGLPLDSENITFYEFPLPEAVILTTSAGGLKELKGGCIEIGERLDLDCETGVSVMPIIAASMGWKASFAPPICRNLKGKTKIDPDKDIFREWYPMAMELYAENKNKYLVILLPDISENPWDPASPNGFYIRREGFYGGPAYFITGVRTIDSFKTLSDLTYWITRYPNPSKLYYYGPAVDLDSLLEAEKYAPKSCIIIPIISVKIHSG